MANLCRKMLKITLLYNRSNVFLNGDTLAPDLTKKEFELDLLDRMNDDSAIEEEKLDFPSQIKTDR